MSANALVQARLAHEVAEEAARVLAAISLTVSDAVRVLLIRIATEKKSNYRSHRWHPMPKPSRPSKSPGAGNSPKRTMSVTFRK